MLRVLLLLLTWIVLLPRPALAGGPVGPSAMGPEAGARKDKEAQEAEMTEAEKAAEQRRKDRAARVVVLKWPQTTVDYDDDVLRRNVRSRIDRPDALFFPSVDLYQNGRRSPDRTLTPLMQPAWVPDGNLGVITSETQRVSTIPWNAMAPAEWGLEGQKLLALSNTLWFVEKAEQREPLFLLYVQIGKCAENQNVPAPPFYEAIGGQYVNYYFYLAATLAYQDPSLMSKLTDQELNGYVTEYLNQLQQGVYQKFPLDFELENEFDLDTFDGDYEVLINGLPVALDTEARHMVHLGRSDIYVKRKDTGHSLSERLEVDKFEDKAYFVRDVARKKMGIEFIDQLFLHPNECTPELDGDILTFLAIYAKLHGEAEIYIAVPKFGNPNKTWIWRYERQTGQLQLVGGGNDGFPVRFAAVANVGLLYNGGQVSFNSEVTDADVQNILEATPRDEAGDRLDYDLTSGTLPVNFLLRGHYNRLMVEWGMEFGKNIGENDPRFVEYYYTPVGAGDWDGDKLVVVEEETREENLDTDGEVAGPDKVSGVEALHYSSWNRYIWWGTAVVLGRDASLGFGPRLGVRVGWTNLPRAVQPTAHFGWSLEAPIPGLKGTNRVRPMLDVDARAGLSIATPGSLQGQRAQANDEINWVYPVFGLTGGIGTTF